MMSFKPHFWICSLLIASVLCVAGCNDFNPGKWSQQEVADDMKMQFKLTEITLSPSEGGFTGTAKDGSGESFKVTVKQDPIAKKSSYVLNGDRGAELTGSASVAK